MDQATWDVVIALDAAPERIAGLRRTPGKRILSGLIRWSVCNGSFTVVATERWGSGTAGRSSLCTNTRTIDPAQLEHRVLGALRHRLLQPDLVEAFVEEYRRASESAWLATAGSRAKVECARATIARRIERLTDLTRCLG